LIILTFSNVASAIEMLPAYQQPKDFHASRPEFAGLAAHYLFEAWPCLSRCLGLELQLLRDALGEIDPHPNSAELVTLGQSLQSLAPRLISPVPDGIGPIQFYSGTLLAIFSDVVSVVEAGADHLEKRDLSATAHAFRQVGALVKSYLPTTESEGATTSHNELAKDLSDFGISVSLSGDTRRALFDLPRSHTKLAVLSFAHLIHELVGAVRKGGHDGSFAGRYLSRILGARGQVSCSFEGGGLVFEGLVLPSEEAQLMLVAQRLALDRYARATGSLLTKLHLCESFDDDETTPTHGLHSLKWRLIPGLPSDKPLGPVPPQVTRGAHCRVDGTSFGATRILLPMGEACGTVHRPFGAAEVVSRIGGLGAFFGKVVSTLKNGFSVSIEGDAKSAQMGDSELIVTLNGPSGVLTGTVNDFRHSTRRHWLLKLLSICRFERIDVGALSHLSHESMEKLCRLISSQDERPRISFGQVAGDVCVSMHGDPKKEYVLQASDVWEPRVDPSHPA
jgi:hypothetical protein